MPYMIVSEVFKYLATIILGGLKSLNALMADSGLLKSVYNISKWVVEYKKLNIPLSLMFVVARCASETRNWTSC